MFLLDEALRVYLQREPIDFRLNINGLALLVKKALGLHLTPSSRTTTAGWSGPSPVQMAYAIPRRLLNRHWPLRFIANYKNRR